MNQLFLHPEVSRRNHRNLRSAGILKTCRWPPCGSKKSIRRGDEFNKLQVFLSRLRTISPKSDKFLPDEGKSGETPKRPGDSTAIAGPRKK